MSILLLESTLFNSIAEKERLWVENYDKDERRMKIEKHYNVGRSVLHIRYNGELTGFIIYLHSHMIREITILLFF